ncbi:hypothetical protein KP509_36G024200 [Ceratopteris richardii]|uniref:Kinesin motor domain-containing protein n=1 Tax=Ceratopteris richardii TaxID=49495 RepID=A0A8T2QAE7_CERRI|nr:hypothetical protein KP509_36G024200 [Ceratopteris richardii]KAH7280989.1 hypothetical protein KP509_36G024200 [Ceratopteris richardii]KAH7280990.1 hypothetical protein KP509_36G024200 [Ceratopteris richardii]KAH7280991.1 hypothetical protein KP509_36G024200 [Ceratopteris richardii]KAH7280992.1 hypothetical protein KP509_36G024200 [Ceratopteris richardii]
MSVISLPDCLERGAGVPSEMEGRWHSRATEEKIFVTVRVRPLSAKELSKNDFSVWECLDDSTISYTYNMSDRASFPQSYSFDKVFGAGTTTHEVYEQGAKDVALSALSGKNATIFAYGQTSSGKTYTMHGVTESAANDIFAHIEQNDDRIYLLKFSALEIYNEVASDLLNPESGPLRLMDDPERGTIIERLEEKVVEDKEHLHSLLDLCETHRQVGETALNDISSRSHQIIRLSIESSPRVVSDERPMKSLIAVLNFVDLAGSERASLSHSEGMRLKEGCYINRSLLTLSSVIRKLSEANKGRTGHVPYRDSKLTRILQNSLGGNARTAIICTMSSSNRHVEQTRNTLFFASCAKEVTNRAHINMVISDKELIKQLKKEVALLEAKLRLSTFSFRSSSEAQLQEKDMQIQKMQEEMRLAFQQRDLAQAQLDTVLKQMEEVEQTRAIVLSKINAAENSLSSSSDDHASHGLSSSDETSEQERSISLKFENGINSKWSNGNTHQPHEIIKTEVSEKQGTSASAVLLQEIFKLEHLQKELAQDANRALEAVQKEVECLRLAQSGLNEEAAENVAKLQAEINEIYETRVTGTLDADSPVTKALIVEESRKSISLKDQIQKIVAKDKAKNGEFEGNNVDLEEMLQNMHISVEELGLPMLPATSTPLSKLQQDLGCFSSARSSVDGNHQTLRLSSTSKRSLTFDGNTHPQAEENIKSVHAYVTDLKERVGKLQYQKQLLASRVLELERNENPEEDPVNLSLTSSPGRWASEFFMKRKQIFELWDLCHVSLLHRTQFYLLFRGDPADAMYVEVELRRLLWLRNNHQNGKPGTRGLRDEQVASPGSSMRTLKRERESLVRYMKTGLTASERESIYKEWGIPLYMKQRKLKVAYLIWTNPYDEDHIKMSAELVSRLVGLWNRHGPASKEMFQLSFSPPSNEKTWFGWNQLSNLFIFRN